MRCVVTKGRILKSLKNAYKILLLFRPGFIFTTFEVIKK